jgi:hypothetical protein
MGLVLATLQGSQEPVLSAEPGNPFDLLVGLLPNLVQPVPVPERGHVERVARGEGKIGREDRDVGRRGDRIVVALGGVERAALHRPEQLALGDQLVGGVELDLHLAVGGLVEGVDRGLDHVLGQGRPGIGLQPPADRRLGAHHVGCGQRSRTGGRDPGTSQEPALARHRFLPFSC